MKFTQEVKNTIRRFILKNIKDHSNDIGDFTAKYFEITKPPIYRILKDLISEGIIIKTGAGRYPKYKILTKEYKFSYDVNDGLEEDVIWRKEIVSNLYDIENNIKELCQYGFTEMVNNVIDHSGSNVLEIILKDNYFEIEIRVIDYGIGIFKKIQDALNLENPKHSILELAKGKFTSDPSRHSGEGIFFSSRVFDYYAIFSQNLAFSGNEYSDWLFEDISDFQGTLVVMKINKKSTTKLIDVFDKFSDPDKMPSFHKTIVPVKLMQYEGESLLSRSQAKRLINRFDKFLEVVLDFSGVNIIGQAFSDEIFRVFKNAHPHVHLIPININDQVTKMIRHVLGNIPDAETDKFDKP